LNISVKFEYVKAEKRCHDVPVNH